ncbi:arylsulfatase [Halosimplex carlsbadense 2-9-1]|uniref:Arylsulfatase n=1 Tax=Halosimplex carlsbadense 2-9-1 TaxID=797114 RepID=M0D494_9EURY|nr:sulfatase-like hydrolase/transferase [Halosimplex carlsbadense]ELZ29663.1 arylsulfatase [Halosimplex carlsbadense 2-9-1]
MTNIALVVLDTLRKDTFDDHFDWLPGVRFENAWSPTAWTTPAHAALFGGAYPSELGVYAKTQSLDCTRPVLAEALSEAGYRTRAFSANANIAAAFEFDRGFDEFRHSWRGRKHDEDIFDWGNFVSETQDQGPSRFLRAVYECLIGDVDTVASLDYGVRMKARDMGIESVAGADDGARLALEHIRETEFGDQEFFFANLMEVHGPYNPPSEYRQGEYTGSPNIDDTIGDGPDESVETIRGAYEDCARYLSDVYSDIFAALREEFDYVITLADHGELFGEDGAWAHNHGIYPDLVHVPLSVYDGREGTTHREDPVSLIDVHRTILGLAGASALSRGHDLLGEIPERDLLVERYGLRTNRIEQMPANGYDDTVIEWYDQPLEGIVLHDAGYAYETLDGVEDGGIDDADPWSRLDALRDHLDEAAVSPDEETVPEDVQARLEDLGYA